MVDNNPDKNGYENSKENVKSIHGYCLLKLIREGGRMPLPLAHHTTKDTGNTQVTSVESVADTEIIGVCRGSCTILDFVLPVNRIDDA